MSKLNTSALWQLARSTHLRKRIREEFGVDRAKRMTRMMDEGEFEGDDGDALHDFLIDGISNDAVLVWETVSVDSYYDNPEWEWPIYITRFHGVYEVQSPECDPAGIFDSLEEAKSYVYSNWANARPGYRVKPSS
jgi:hypothetical protein